MTRTLGCFAMSSGPVERPFSMAFSLNGFFQVCFSINQINIFVDYVPNDIRPLNINLKVGSLNVKLSITNTYNQKDCVNNSRKGIHNTSRMEANAFGIWTSPIPTARQQLFVT